MALVKCAECGNEISDKAPGCPKCGRPLEVVVNKAKEEYLRREYYAKLNSEEPAKSMPSGTAAVLSLFIPGAGQIYSGRIPTGLAWLFFTVVGYSAFIVPGLILHLLCIFKAYEN